MVMLVLSAVRIRAMVMIVLRSVGVGAVVVLVVGAVLLHGGTAAEREDHRERSQDENQAGRARGHWENSSSGVC